MTKIFKSSISAIRTVVNKLKVGELVCFPTETVYALACDPCNNKAIASLYDLKQRNTSQPLSLLVKDLEQIKQIAQIDSEIEAFINKHSPGPITYILNKKEDFIMSPLINSNNATIGVRIPDHPIAQQILTLFGRSIIGTSTNISGKESAINVDSIDSCLLNTISIVIDDGPTKFGIGSTIVDLTNSQEFKILRKGALIIK